MIPGLDSQGTPGRADSLGRWIENILLALVLFGMIGLAIAQVVLRDLAGRGFAWGDEALRLLVLWAAMLGAVAASRNDAHLRIDLLSRFLPERGRATAAIVVDLFTAFVAAVLAWYSWLFVGESREFGEKLLVSLPAWPFQSILPVAFSLIAYRYFIWFLRRLKAAFAGTPAT